MSGNRRTDNELEEALNTAVDLLDLGVPAYAVVAHLRRRCGISRSAAYRDVQEAEDIRRERGYEPQISASESAGIMPAFTGSGPAGGFGRWRFEVPCSPEQGTA